MSGKVPISALSLPDFATAARIEHDGEQGRVPVLQWHPSRRVCRIPLVMQGAVAQLGERRVRNAKVGSSILLGSTIITESQTLFWLFFALTVPDVLASRPWAAFRRLTR